MEGNSTDLLAERASRKAKRTKGKLTRQKEKGECWRTDGKRHLQRTENLTEGQEQNKVNSGRKPAIKIDKLE